MSARGHQRPCGAPVAGTRLQRLRDHRRPRRLAQSRRTDRDRPGRRPGAAAHLQLKRRQEHPTTATVIPNREAGGNCSATLGGFSRRPCIDPHYNKSTTFARKEYPCAGHQAATVRTLKIGGTRTTAEAAVSDCPSAACISASAELSSCSFWACCSNATSFPCSAAAESPRVPAPAFRGPTGRKTSVSSPLNSSSPSSS